MTQLTAALSTILLGMRESIVRAEGHCSLMETNCMACSGFPTQIKPIKYELDITLERAEKLLDVLDKETAGGTT